MSRQKANIVIGSAVVVLLLLVAVVFGVRFYTQPNTNNNTPQQVVKVAERAGTNSPVSKLLEKYNYINPSTFDVGLIPPPVPYKSSNLCNDKVLKPTIQPQVDYQIKEMPPIKDCSCLQFLAPP